jgi:ornithine cyclodeaminase/alanine dehydrogenase-like protein (mu-crystallin family)
MEQDRQRLQKHLDIGREMWYLTKAEVAAVGLSVPEVLDLTRAALVAHGTGRSEMPAKIGVHPFPEVFFHAMPAWVPGSQAVGCKWIECYPGNPEKYQLPQTTGLLVLNDVLSGCPIVVMDCTLVTALRTPAVTVLAAAALHPDAETFGMFGRGVQGAGHVRYAAHALKRLKAIHVYDTSPAAMDRLVAQLQPEVPVPIIKGEGFEQVAKACEVLCSATVIVRTPMACVKDAWVGRGQTLLPCDLNTFFEPAIARRADKYIVDSTEAHELLARAGYFPDGLPEVTCQTGEVLAGRHPGRERRDELIVCSNIGMAVCDVVVGREVLNRAMEKGIGRKLPL